MLQSPPRHHIFPAYLYHQLSCECHQTTLGEQEEGEPARLSEEVTCALGLTKERTSPGQGREDSLSTEGAEAWKGGECMDMLSDRFGASSGMGEQMDWDVAGHACWEPFKGLFSLVVDHSP